MTDFCCNNKDHYIYLYITSFWISELVTFNESRNNVLADICYVLDSIPLTHTWRSFRYESKPMEFYYLLSKTIRFRESLSSSFGKGDVACLTDIDFTKQFSGWLLRYISHFPVSLDCTIFAARKDPQRGRETK